MRSLRFLPLACLLICSESALRAQYAQPLAPVVHEQYGNTLNLGIGEGYYSYTGYIVTALHADYEFRIAHNFTLAPFIELFSFHDQVYWGDPQNNYRYYHYHEVDVPMGAKCTYYLDEALNLNKNWDLYVAASLGLTMRTITWQEGDNAPSSFANGEGPMFLELHVGGEYHINNRLGVYLDLSTRVSTIGLSIHKR